MKVTSKVDVKEMTATHLVNKCPSCGFEEEIPLDILGLSEVVEKTVSFTVPDNTIMRDDQGRAIGTVPTVELLT